MTGKMDVTTWSEQQEIDHVNAFVGQFTLTDQVQLMSWVDELMKVGRVEVSESHRLYPVFDRLVQFINHQIDDLMPETLHMAQGLLPARCMGNALVSRTGKSKRKERDMPKNTIVEDVDDAPLTPAEVDRAIADLRAEGYDIRETIDPDGQIRYVLHGLDC